MRADFMVTSKSPGFTLIELMVAVAIIGILAAIAIPSYEQYIKRGIRTDAKSALLKNAQFLERNYTEANKFDEDSGGDAIVLPNAVSPESGTTLYQISTSDLTETTFTLQAAPVAGQRMENDECGTFTLNHLGQKGVSGATLSAEDCWNR